MSETQVWEHVLKWGLAQNPELPSDITNFSKEDFGILKNSLQQCIPFIRFYNLTSKEFLDNVFPYREVLPEELHVDLLRAFLSLSPDSKPSNKSKPGIIEEINMKTVDSKIITFQHAVLISKWIDRLEITDEIKNSYKFKLLYRGSRDGLKSQRFHEICDNQFRTVTIVKVKGSSEILGGYNPISWKSDRTFGVTKDSFIFSFKYKDSIENNILSRVINERRAIYNDGSYGPTFGNSDIVIFEYNIQTGNCASRM